MEHETQKQSFGMKIAGIVNLITLIVGIILLFTDLSNIGLILILICIFVVIVFYLIDSSQLKELNKKKEELKLKEYNDNILNYTEKYGDITKKIEIAERDINKQIIVFESSQRIIILGKDIPLSDVISCDIQDKTIVCGGDLERHRGAVSTIGRAAVGGVLFGGVGATIGGLSGKETLEKSPETTLHFYSALITINSLSDPVIKIDLSQSDDKKIVDELFSLMKVIVRRNDNKK